MKSRSEHIKLKYATVEHLGIYLDQTEDEQERERIRMLIEHMEKHNIQTAGEALRSLGLVPAA